MTPLHNLGRKLKEIQEMALSFDQALRSEFKEDMREARGRLFMGRYYADSHRICFTVNPEVSGLEQDAPFAADLYREVNFNLPFQNPDGENTAVAYWHNWGSFLTQYEDLGGWFNDKLTSTFMVPWWRPDAPSLEGLNRQARERVYEYSAKLIHKMIEHHRAKLVIIPSKSALYLLNDILGNPWRYTELLRSRQGARSLFQWRRLEYKRVTVLQIPDIGHASNKFRLKPVAAWLREVLEPFGFMASLADDAPPVVKPQAAAKPPKATR